MTACSVAYRPDQNYHKHPWHLPRGLQVFYRRRDWQCAATTFKAVEALG